MEFIFWFFIIVGYATLMFVIAECVLKKSNGNPNIFRIVFVMPGMLAFFALAQGGGHMMDFDKTEMGTPKDPVTTYFGLSDDKNVDASKLTRKGTDMGTGIIIGWDGPKHVMIARLATEGDISTIYYGGSAYGTNQIANYEKSNVNVHLGDDSDTYIVWVSKDKVSTSRFFFQVYVDPEPAPNQRHISSILTTHDDSPVVLWEEYTFGTDENSIVQNVTGIKAVIVEAPDPEVWSLWHLALALLLMLYIIGATLGLLFVDRGTRR